MKRSVAAALGLVVAGAGAFGIYKATRSSSTPAAATATAHESSAPPAPSTAPTEAPPTAKATPATPEQPAAAASEASATASPPATGSAPAAEPSAAAGSAGAAGSAADRTPVEPHSTRAFKERPTSVPVPESKGAQLNTRFEAAACRAPGIQDRYRQLDTAERAKLKARCAKVGVTLSE